MAWRISKPLPTVNTVEFNFGPCRQISQDYVLRWIRKLGVSIDKLTGIMAVNSSEAKIIWIKFNKTEDYVDFMSKYEGNHQVIVKIDDRDVTVSARIYPAGMKLRRVTLYGVHFEIQQEDIQDSMSYYGKVASVRREKFAGQEAGDYMLDSGKVIVTMEIGIHIPQVVIMGGYEVYVRYAGQPPICFACRKQGHIASECENRSKRQRDREDPWGNKQTQEPTSQKENSEAQQSPEKPSESSSAQSVQEEDGDWITVRSRKSIQEARRQQQATLREQQAINTVPQKRADRKNRSKKKDSEHQNFPVEKNDNQTTVTLQHHTADTGSTTVTTSGSGGGENAAENVGANIVSPDEVPLPSNRLDHSTSDETSNGNISQASLPSLGPDWSQGDTDALRELLSRQQADSSHEKMDVQTFNLKRSLDPDGADVTAMPKRGLLDENTNKE